MLTTETIYSKIKAFLSHTPGEAFVFSSLDFWIFFGLFLSVLAFFYRRTKSRNFVILLFSLFFYYKSSGFAILLLLFTLTEDFVLALLIERSANLAARRLLLVVSIFSNLLVLSYFKYTFFFIDGINHLFSTHIEKINWLALWIPQNPVFSLDVHSILLPVGISFFTFQSLSYTIDVYRGQIKPLTSWFDFAFFASFFPQLVAGPIVRAKDFVNQIFLPYQVDKQQFGKGLGLILSGLVKKIILSDILSTQLVDRVFDQPEIASSLEAWLGLYGYGLQIFCDFSGYTDIAIGIALVLGFRLLPNFDEPYKSQSITEFWRRWHISLSVWLRDYLYIPLGGNRKGIVRTYINLLITMLLGGLWHGAHFKFILWGGLHGIALAMHKLWSSFSTRHQLHLPAWLGWFVTFHFALFCWVPFRAADVPATLLLIQKMWGGFDFTLFQAVVAQYKLPVLLLVVGYGLHFLPTIAKQRYTALFESIPTWLQVIVCTLVVFAIYQFKTAESQPFIYFQF